MAYGKGKHRKSVKRVADLGEVPLYPDLVVLREKYLLTVRAMAIALWPDDILDDIPDGKAVDAILMQVQSQASKDGFNNVWAEKARFAAKSAVLEQWKRARKNLFGRFKHLDTIGDKPLDDGNTRLVNFPEAFSYALDDTDIAAMKDLADNLDFKEAIEMFRLVRAGTSKLPEIQASALLAMLDMMLERFTIPVWDDAEAIVQLHLDYRCVRGTVKSLKFALDGLSAGLKDQARTQVFLDLASHRPFGPAINTPFVLMPAIAGHFDTDNTEGQEVGSLILEIGVAKARAKMVVVRPEQELSIAGYTTVVANDFGFVNTASIAVLRSATGVGQDVLERIEAGSSKTQSKAFLENNISNEDAVQLVETVQLDGRDFLDRLVEMAKHVEVLRSEIDRNYNRLGRIRAEMNLIAGREKDFLVPETCPEASSARYRDMHGRFFRILEGIGKLKTLRRAIYRSVSGLKKSWLGHCSGVVAKLAIKHGAFVAEEDLDIVAIPKDDPRYKGRTFNRMINNGAAGQYNRSSKKKMEWLGIPRVKVPSFYTSSTDWRNGTVDQKQRNGLVFKARSDGKVWDADLHAAETIGRWFFLTPKIETGRLLAA